MTLRPSYAIVWLGGKKVDEKWTWSDGTPWNFENWMIGFNSEYKNDEKYVYMSMQDKGKWWTSNGGSNQKFTIICQSKGILYLYLTSLKSLRLRKLLD